jgi:hypothetical protein
MLDTTDPHPTLSLEGEGFWRAPLMEAEVSGLRTE